jgi:LEA14-like dessication related protein
MMPRLDAPRVGLEAVRVTSITASGVEVALSLDVENPNARAIRIDGLDFTIEVSGIMVADGHTLEPVEIAGSGSGLAKIMATSSFANWSAVARRLAGRTSIDYVITGTAQVNGSALPFSRRGAIDTSALLGRHS